MDTTPGAAAFTRIVRGIRAGDPAGMEALCAQFDTGLRLLLARSLGHDRAPELAREVSRAVAGAIQGGEPPDPMRLPGLVRTVARRFLDQELAGSSEAKKVKGKFKGRQLDPKRAKIATAVLKSMPPENREVLRRFYLRKQSPLRVCSEMNLSLEQFHRLTSQARQEFAAELRGKPVASARTLKGRPCAVQGAGNAAAS